MGAPSWLDLGFVGFRFSNLGILIILRPEKVGERVVFGQISADFAIYTTNGGRKETTHPGGYVRPPFFLCLLSFLKNLNF